MEPGLLRVEDAARYLAVGRSTLYGMIQRGDVPTVHIGRAVRIPTQALRDLVKTWSTAGV